MSLSMSSTLSPPPPDAALPTLTALDKIAGDWVIRLTPASVAEPDIAPIRVLTSLEETGDVVAFLSPSSVLADETRIYPRDAHGRWTVDATGTVACRCGGSAYDDRGAHVGELHMRVQATIDVRGELQGTYERRDLNARGELHRFRSGFVRGFRTRDILRAASLEVETPRF